MGGVVLKDEQAAFHECTGAVQQAHTILNDAVQTRNVCTKTLTDAQFALTETAVVLAHSRQNTRKYQSTIEKAVRDLTLAEARLDAFRSGPVVAFHEFRPDSPAASFSEAQFRPSPAEPAARMQLDAFPEEPSSEMQTDTPPAKPSRSEAGVTPNLQDFAMTNELAMDDAHEGRSPLTTTCCSRKSWQWQSRSSTWMQSSKQSTRAGADAALALVTDAIEDPTLVDADADGDITLDDGSNAPAMAMESTSADAPTEIQSVWADAQTLAWAPTLHDDRY